MTVLTFSYESYLLFIISDTVFTDKIEKETKSALYMRIYPYVHYKLKHDKLKRIFK